MKTIILVANKDEASHIRDLESDTCNIIITGEGRTNVITTIARALKDGKITDNDTIINIGYAGAYGYEKGDIVYVDRVEPFTPSKTIIEPPMTLNNDVEKMKSIFISGQCLTADNFVEIDDINPDLPKQFVCDMELYWISLMLNNVIPLKIVSDNLKYAEYTEANFERSWEKIRNVLKELL